MTNSAARIYVTRFLASDRVHESLTQLYLFARDSDACNSANSVWEIGAFVAHKRHREKGVTWKRVDELLSIASYLSVSLLKNAEFDLTRLPAVFVAHATATAARLTSDMWEDIGFKQQKGKKLVERALRKLTANKDGTYRVGLETSQEEQRLLIELGHCWCNVPIMFAENHVSDLLAILRRENVLKSDEVGAFQARQDIISLFAISQMHRRSVLLRDGSLVPLYGDKVCYPAQSQTHIEVASSIAEALAPRLGIKQTIFAPEIELDKGCDAHLRGIWPWDFDVVVNDEGLLSQLS